MLRALILVVVVCIVCRWVFGKWPWEYLRPVSTRSQAIARAHELLGVGTGSGREEIVAAHRRLTALVHPDRGGSNAAMQEANAARDLLLDELPPPQDGASA